MNPLNLIGVKISAVAVAAALALAGVQSYRLSREQVAHAQTKVAHSELVAAMERGAREAVESARAEEQRRTSEVQKVADEANQQLDRARADAVSAADAGQRLRARLAQITAACRAAPSHSGPATPGAPAISAEDLLADVQRRLDDAADRIARFADESHASGAACQRSYDALTQR